MLYTRVYRNGFGQTYVRKRIGRFSVIQICDYMDTCIQIALYQTNKCYNGEWVLDRLTRVR